MEAEELKQKWITGRTNIISNMLDNPDEYEIYPTTKCFTALDDLHNELLAEHAQQVSIGFSNHLSDIVANGDDLCSFKEEFKEWIKDQQ